ncbi:MAG: 1-acyl-sn-glycerol-3-phosphate acyltransferase, partial [Clostridia bacterium]|nr:1-acyl-sn-glycerol-3-phosphate acyltransferase [Clostridia bacterium]
RTKIYFPERFPKEEAAICACNHFSSMDANQIMTKLIKKNYNVMIKGEAFKCRFIGDILLSLGGIPVQRGEGDIGAVRSAMRCIGNGEKIVIFPEGTRYKGDMNNYELLQLKQGVPMIAIKTKCTIVPLMYYRKISPFKRNYLIVGEPFDFSEFYGLRGEDTAHNATQKLRQNMLDAYSELKVIVEQFKGNEKKYKNYLADSTAEV